MHGLKDRWLKMRPENKPLCRNPKKRLLQWQYQIRKQRKLNDIKIFGLIAKAVLF